jgi:uncharacterized protein
MGPRARRFFCHWCFKIALRQVWPAIVLHAAWNSIIQNPFDRSLVGAGAKLWAGESGVLVAVTTLIVGWLVYQRCSKDGAKLLNM